MANEPKKTLKEYLFPTMDEIRGSIVRPPIYADNFEINPTLISLVMTSFQFGGLPSEDPNLHLTSFLQICDTIKYDGVSEDAIKLRLFPFSLKDRAARWLYLLPTGSITTWNQLCTQFLEKFFPPSKAAMLRRNIIAFSQLKSESLYEAWERFQDLLSKCPRHGLPKWHLAHIFFNGLGPLDQLMLHVAVGCSLNEEEPTAKAYDLIDAIASNSCYQSHISNDCQEGNSIS